MLEGQRQKEITKRKKAMLRIGHKLISNRENGIFKAFNWMIDTFSNFDGVVDPSHATIAKHARCSIKTIKRAMKELNNRNLIHCQRRGKMLTNLYSINWEIIDSKSKN